MRTEYETTTIYQPEPPPWGAVFLGSVLFFGIADIIGGVAGYCVVRLLLLLSPV